MRHNPKHAVTDEAIVRRLIAEHPWTTFVSDTSNGLVASHYPALIEDTSDGSLALVTHLGRPDDRVHELTEARELLAIVQGPHGYVSPSWYAPGATRAPTWNFTVAHLTGTPEILSDEENLATLTRLVAHFEQHVEEPMYLERAFADKLAPGTVGMRLRVERFVCKQKLSADKDPVSQQNVIDALSRPGPYEHPALASDMRRALDLDPANPSEPGPAAD